MKNSQHYSQKEKMTKRQTTVNERNSSKTHD